MQAGSSDVVKVEVEVVVWVLVETVLCVLDCVLVSVVVEAEVAVVDTVLVEELVAVVDAVVVKVDVGVEYWGIKTLAVMLSWPVTGILNLKLATFAATNTAEG